MQREQDHAVNELCRMLGCQVAVWWSPCEGSFRVFWVCNYSLNLESASSAMNMASFNLPYWPCNGWMLCYHSKRKCCSIFYSSHSSVDVFNFLSSHRWAVFTFTGWQHFNHSVLKTHTGCYFHYILCQVDLGWYSTYFAKVFYSTLLKNNIDLVQLMLYP